jgi:hypothetical protein
MKAGGAKKNRTAIPRALPAVAPLQSAIMIRHTGQNPDYPVTDRLHDACE